MCMASDIAMFMIAKSIENKEKENNPSCYLDFYKINKLLYICQCEMLQTYKTPMFSEDILAYSCGPYIESIEFIFVDWEYNPISKPYSKTVYLPTREASIIDEVLGNFGKLSRHELGQITKAHEPYLLAYNSEDTSCVIQLEQIEKSVKITA